MRLISKDFFGLYDERKFFRVTTNSQRTLSFLKLKRPWWSAILQAPKMCAKVQILFPHKNQHDSVISLRRFKLLELGSVSNVAPKQNEIKERGIARNVFQERSFFTKLHHFIQWPCKWNCTDLAWYAFSSTLPTKSETSLLYSWEFLWGIDGLFNDPKPALDVWWYPITFWNYFQLHQLLSVSTTASATSQKPHFNWEADSEICLSADSLNNKCPLTLVDLSIDVRLFKGRGQGEVEEYRHIFVVEWWILSHFLKKEEILCSMQLTTEMEIS